MQAAGAPTFPSYSSDQEAAALKIQSLQRGKTARSRVQTLKASDLEKIGAFVCIFFCCSSLRLLCAAVVVDQSGGCGVGAPQMPGGAAADTSGQLAMSTAAIHNLEAAELSQMMGRDTLGDAEGHGQTTSAGGAVLHSRTYTDHQDQAALKIQALQRGKAGRRRCCAHTPSRSTCMPTFSCLKKTFGCSVTGRK